MSFLPVGRRDRHNETIRTLGSRHKLITAMELSKFAENLEPGDQSIVFMASDEVNGELLRIERDGFYVRGIKLEQDANEARAVFEAIREWLSKNN